MRGSAQMLGRSLGEEERRTRELVDMIVGEVDRLERVVAALTELGRPHEPSIEETLIEPLLTRAVEFVTGQATSQQVTITQHAERPCLALCDPEQIYQVALNLLVNALHVLPTGGRIDVRTFGPEQRAGSRSRSRRRAGHRPELQGRSSPVLHAPGGRHRSRPRLRRARGLAHQGGSRAQHPGGATFRVELPAAEGMP
jgi:nitrogen-specific signal transduction histidine kinase